MYHVEWIDNITFVFAHLVALGIEDKTRRDDVLERYGVEHHRSDGMQCKEPPACLVHSLVNEVGRECLALVNLLAVLERIVYLGIWHRA